MPDSVAFLLWVVPVFVCQIVIIFINHFGIYDFEKYNVIKMICIFFLSFIPVVGILTVIVLVIEAFDASYDFDGYDFSALNKIPFSRK